MKRNIIVIFIILSAITNIFSQNLKYKDIFPLVENKDYLVAYSYLLSYQRQDPDFINTYFQLGVISYKWCMEADPLLEYDRVKYFAYNTRLFFGLAKSKMLKNKSEVRKNRKLYQNVPELAKEEKLNNEQVLSYMNMKMAEIEDYEKNITKIYSYFNQVVKTYNKTLQLYRDFLKGYPNLKTIYLMPVSELYPTLDSIQSYFDSTVYAFKSYRQAIETYPIKYNQHLKLTPIKVYRLDGVTGSDLLADNVFLWDYSSWIKNVKKTIETDISNLRKVIVATDEQMNKKEKFYIETNKYSDKYEGFNLKDKVINLIEKYDYSSMMSAFFLYRDAKIDYLAFSKHVFNDRNDTSLTIRQRAKSYKILEDYAYGADSLLDVFSARIKPENILKYRDFISEHYKNGFKQYVIDQRGFLATYRNKNLENYKYFIFRDKLFFKFAPNYVVYKNISYPLFISDSDISTTYIDKSATGELFLTGMNKGKPYLLKTDKTSVLWYKQLPEGYTPSLSVAYFGGVLSLSSNIKQGKISVKNYDNDGKLTGEKVISVPAYAKSVVFNDINGSLLVVSKDTSVNRFTFTNSPLYVNAVNLYSGDDLWSYSFDLNGNVVSSVRMDTVFYIFVNFATFELSPDKIYHGDNPQSLGVLKISESGKILGFEKLFDEPVFAIDAIKLSSETINIVGLDAPAYDIYKRPFENQAKLKYYIYYK